MNSKIVNKDISNTLIQYILLYKSPIMNAKKTIFKKNFRRLFSNLHRFLRKMINYDNIDGNFISITFTSEEKLNKTDKPTM